jgi:hypothetical protein
MGLTPLLVKALSLPVFWIVALVNSAPLWH